MRPLQRANCVNTDYFYIIKAWFGYSIVSNTSYNLISGILRRSEMTMEVTS